MNLFTDLLQTLERRCVRCFCFLYLCLDLGYSVALCLELILAQLFLFEIWTRLLDVAAMAIFDLLRLGIYCSVLVDFFCNLSSFEVLRPVYYLHFSFAEYQRPALMLSMTFSLVFLCFHDLQSKSELGSSQSST